MGRHVQLSTESAIVSRGTVEQIRMLITDLTRTVEILDANIAVEERPCPDDLVRRHNLTVTIASLEDYLGSIERMRSRGYGAEANCTPAVPPH